MANPFDWTFTSRYAGSVQNCSVSIGTLSIYQMILIRMLQVEASDEMIDVERLKRQEPIGFYAQVTLYEDELADHGTAQMSVRLRVMPNFFFVLMRFYLRIDRVLVRVCDTRLLGDNGKDYMVREWSLREAKVADLEHLVRASLAWLFLLCFELILGEHYGPLTVLTQHAYSLLIYRFAKFPRNTS
ncbi:unnamed protein product [Strongylus vulgaris]|uniref:TIP41-like protein n=1 Tax=Strongylus vulgaris TaxID=40348 RepID=A0A3P7J103_STRVU|nr:unnamed protein product [Strongylus vulgaris]